MFNNFLPKIVPFMR